MRALQASRRSSHTHSPITVAKLPQQSWNQKVCGRVAAVLRTGAMRAIPVSSPARQCSSTSPPSVSRNVV
jgi:hypothetical protein